MVGVVSLAYVAMFAGIGSAPVQPVRNGVLVYLARTLVVWIASCGVGFRLFALVAGVLPWYLRRACRPSGTGSSALLPLGSGPARDRRVCAQRPREVLHGDPAFR